MSAGHSFIIHVVHYKRFAQLVHQRDKQQKQAIYTYSSKLYFELYINFLFQESSKLIFFLLEDVYQTTANTINMQH